MISADGSGFMFIINYTGVLLADRDGVLHRIFIMLVLEGDFRFSLKVFSVNQNITYLYALMARGINMITI